MMVNDMTIRLKQLNKTQLNSIIESGPSSLEYQIIRKALPPTRIFLSVQRLLSRGEDPKWALPFLIIHGELVIGCCGFEGVTRYKTTEIGYSIAVEYQGRGFATQAVKAMCFFAFESNDVNEIEAYISSDNVASRRVLEKNSFQYVITKRTNEGKKTERWRLQRASG